MQKKPEKNMKEIQKKYERNAPLHRRIRHFKKTPFEMKRKCFKAMFFKYFKNIPCL